MKQLSKIFTVYTCLALISVASLFAGPGDTIPTDSDAYLSALSKRHNIGGTTVEDQGSVYFYSLLEYKNIAVSDNSIFTFSQNGIYKISYGVYAFPALGHDFLSFQLQKRSSSNTPFVAIAGSTSEAQLVFDILRYNTFVTNSIIIKITSSTELKLINVSGCSINFNDSEGSNDNASLAFLTIEKIADIPSASTSQ